MDAIQQVTNKKFFYLKLGGGNLLAKDWLAGKNPLKQPAAVIFFGDKPIRETRNSQAQDFYASSLLENRTRTLMMVVGHGRAWFLKPIGSIEECTPPQDATYSLDSLWKMMPVEIILEKQLNEVPPILAGINANAYLSRGTFREISHLGNIKAICSVLNDPLPREHLNDDNCKTANLLECLSSVELETLVAKIFEAAGCFVPAYRGGYIKDIDLFVHNDKSESIQLGGLEILPGQGKSIQVKGKTGLKDVPTSVNYLIAIGLPNSPNCYNEDWLLHQIRSHPQVLAWFKRSINWLPNEFLSKYDLTEIAQR